MKIIIILGCLIGVRFCGKLLNEESETLRDVTLIEKRNLIVYFGIAFVASTLILALLTSVISLFCSLYYRVFSVNKCEVVNVASAFLNLEKQMYIGSQ